MTESSSTDEGTNDEREQVKRAKQRDAAIWGAWYDTYYANLFRYAYARIGSREDAEDLASQVFVEALKGIDGFNYKGRPVLAWLYGIARNLVAQRYRADSRTRTAPLAPAEEPNASAADAVIDRVDIEKALVALTPDQQDVIILRFFLSMSVRETAMILGKTENAVPVLQVRALAALRRQMAEPESVLRELKRRGGND